MKKEDIIVEKLTDVSKKLVKHDEKFESVIEKLTDVSKKLVQHDEQFEFVIEKLAEVSEKLVEHDEKFELTESRFNRIESRLDNMVTKDAFEKFGNRIINTLDAQGVILQRLDQERLMTDLTFKRHENRITALEQNRP